ncbi:SRPBCC family protein [Pseudonocardia sp.]|uniref:SRPBCC family protein n=1 Tax=Pseudonocardia sp. TaxID=60912 RepID=UPI00262333E6|nr:SRPBCC family protein [Pseudonocardia sp.]MCW2722949.1 cyclase/dehydrase [Pseudonocardia sp.]
MSAISKSISVNAPEDQILGIILNVEDYPSWQKEVQKVEVLEKDDQGRPKQATMHVSAMGQAGYYTVEYSYPDGNVEYHLLDGDMMTKNDASFTLAGNGGTTEVTVAMDLAIKWALPEFMVNQLILKGVKDMLKSIKTKAEQA